MKTNKLLLIISIISLISIFFYYIKLKKQYEESFRIIDYRKISGYYDHFYANYFKDSFECPKSTNEILDSTIDERVKEVYFMDPLSKKGYFIKYYPVYNRYNLKREGFVLLSSGIDGVLNNDLKTDTLFTDNLKQRLRLYNENFGLDNVSKSDTIPFHFLEAIFGRKDYLLQYIDCINLYKHQAIKIEPIEMTENLLDVKRIRRNIIGFKGVCNDYSRSGLDNSFTALFQLKDFSVRCKFYDERELGIVPGDSVALIGTFKSSNPNSRVINFERCLIVDLDFDPRFPR